MDSLKETLKANIPRNIGNVEILIYPFLDQKENDFKRSNSWKFLELHRDMVINITRMMYTLYRYNFLRGKNFVKNELCKIFPGPP